MKNLIIQLRTSVVATILLVILTCGFYPGIVYGISQLLFGKHANGSLIIINDQPVGSELIAQDFSDPKYFRPRPSQAGDGYDASKSSGSNLGPTSKRLIDVVSDRVASYRMENGLDSEALVPADAVTASSSGLDPHISLENALIQARRVAKKRSMSDEEIVRLIRQHSESPFLGFLGTGHLNVLKLNLILDGRNWY
ncbi:MAG: K(+)-transporting ATPase subunit C [Desulfomonilaceae bacterium]